MARRRKKDASPVAMLVALAVLAGIVAGPQIVQQNNLLLPLLFGLVVVLTAGFGFILWRAEQHRQAKLRAMQLADVDNMDGVEFEHYIGGLLKLVGYHISYTAGSGDQGVDVLARKDSLLYGIQAKRYKGTVSNHAIMEANAGRLHYRAHKSVVITCSYFTPKAKELAQSTDTKLIDRDTLAEWILAAQEGKERARDVISLD